MVLALALAVHGAWLGERKALLLAWLSAGLGAAVHPGGLVVLPALAILGAGAVAPHLRRAPFRLWCLCCLAAPLLIYAYIPLRAAAGVGSNPLAPMA